MQLKQIIIVEDEVIIALSIKKDMERLGYKVLEILTNYKDVINYIQSNKNIDLILMDINLNDKKDGIETIIDIKKIQNIPFIYISSHTDDKTIEKAIDTNPLSFLSKPYKFKQLKAALALSEYKIQITQSNNITSLSYKMSLDSKALSNNITTFYNSRNNLKKNQYSNFLPMSKIISNENGKSFSKSFKELLNENILNTTIYKLLQIGINKLKLRYCNI